jgi:hypothetical protein
METSTRIIDYHLKERIEGQNLKITLSGRSPLFSKSRWSKKPY